MTELRTTRAVNGLLEGGFAVVGDDFSVDAVVALEDAENDGLGAAGTAPVMYLVDLDLAGERRLACSQA